MLNQDFSHHQTFNFFNQTWVKTSSMFWSSHMSFFFSVYKTFKNNDFSICLRTFWRSTGVMLWYADLSWVTPTCEGTFPKPHPSAAAQLQFKLRSLCLSPTLSRQLAWWKDLRETIPVSDLVLHCQTRMTPHPSPPSPLCLHHLLLL